MAVDFWLISASGNCSSVVPRTGARALARLRVINSDRISAALFKKHLKIQFMALIKKALCLSGTPPLWSLDTRLGHYGTCGLLGNDPKAVTSPNGLLRLSPGRTKALHWKRIELSCKYMKKWLLSLYGWFSRHFGNKPGYQWVEEGSGLKNGTGRGKIRT